MFHFGDKNQNNNTGVPNEGTFSVGFFPESEEANSVDQAASRKRKIDKEGFVQPATPDIPKSSFKYGLPSKQFGFDELHNQFGFCQKGDNDCDSFQQSTEPGEENVGEFRDESESVISSDDVNIASDQEAISENYSQNSETVDSESETSKATHDKVTELLKELSMETKMVTLQFSNTFDDSEKYESFCVSQLDKLLSEALALEETLKNQKDLLRDRLGAISRTLLDLS